MMDEKIKRSNSKQIMAVSSADYRGIALYEVAGSADVKLFLGVEEFTFKTLEEATACIDHWYDEKKN